MPKIVFTGGGSAGHVTPNLALISALRRQDWSIAYIGSADGIERSIISETDVPFYAISSGKLRRYFDLKNFKDPFKVVKGMFDAYRVLGRLKPDVVFSKGGFVSVPVVAAAKLRRIPVIIHESDMSPGLANKLSLPMAKCVCVNFPETVQHLSASKVHVTGLPIREELMQGKAERGRTLTDFVRSKPILLIMGGSLGAKVINEVVRAELNHLLDSFQIIHLCGKGNLDLSLQSTRGYCQFEYVNKELPDLLALADVVVSRAGATSIFEFVQLQKPMILIPLTRQASRGDQILNAQSFEKAGLAHVLAEESLTPSTLAQTVNQVYASREMYQAACRNYEGQHATETIVTLIHQVAKNNSTIS